MANCKANSCYNNTNYSWSDYCSYHEKCLSKLRENHSYISNIQQIETFETWFNKNCGWVVTYDYSSSSSYPYYIWIVIYEPKQWNKEIPENLKAIKYRSGYSGLSGASDKARRIKNKLQNNGFDDTPVVKVHDEAKSYERFSSIITSPYMISYSVGTYDYNSNIFYWEGSGSDPSNWDKHVRPLDIIKIGKKHKSWAVDFDHVAVYLGNNKVCHMYDYRSPDKYMKARVDNISTFLGNTENTARCGRVWVYHPIIPFKNYRKIARQIACVEKDNYWEGRYDLANRNCEHLANMLVYGVNYSEQVEREEGSFVTRNIGYGALGGIFSLFWHDYSINNGKSTLKLVNELRETEDKLGYTSSEHWRAQEIETKYSQEVPAKDNCRIM